MLVFGVGTALAAVAGVIAGPALVTQSNMAGLLGPDPVRGRRGRRAGLAAGRLRRLAADRPGADLRGLDERLAGRRLRPAQPGLRLDLARRHLGRHHRADRADHALCAAGADPDLPPDGPAREHATHERDHRKRRPAAAGRRRETPILWIVGRGGGRAAAAAQYLQFGRLADDVQPDRHLDHLLAVLQHPARPDRHAVVRSCGVLRPRRLPGDSRHEHHRRQQAADPAARGAPDRRPDRTVVRRPARLGLDPALRDGVRDDLARRRRTDRLVGADPAHVSSAAKPASPPTAPSCSSVRLEFRPANPDLLSGGGVDADRRRSRCMR